MLTEWIVDFQENTWTEMTVLSVENLSCNTVLLINKHIRTEQMLISDSFNLEFQQYISDNKSECYGCHKIFYHADICFLCCIITMKKMISAVITKSSKKIEAKAGYKLRGG